MAGSSPGKKAPPLEVSAWKAPLMVPEPKVSGLPDKVSEPLTVPEDTRCCSFSDKQLSKWLNVSEISNNVVLQLTGTDLYDAHTALRHAHELAKSEFEIHVIATLKLRKHKGFTPWFAGAKTKYRGYLTPEIKNEIMVLGSELDEMENSKETHCVLTFNHQIDPVLLFSPHMAAMKTALHYATFDIRVAGNIQRTLTDSGATCSCITESYRKMFDLPFEPQDESIKDIGGVGGSVTVLGTVSTTVKLGKTEITQQFLVVRHPIAGYHCLLGQDFLAANSCGLLFTPSTVALAIHGMEEVAGPIVCKRKLPKDTDTFMYPTHDEVNSVCSMPKENVPGNKSGHKIDYDDGSPLTGKKKKAMERALFKGEEVGYRIYLAPLQVSGDGNAMPECIQKVIDKHSTGLGTLRGSIPPNTHVKGYDCHIELVPGAKAVHIKQYRLTPREQKELEEKIKSFIEQGWIEPSISGWSSSVLFIPKPGGKLRFCVDYRRLNAVTQLDKSPIPLQAEMLDRLQGAEFFSALDLASGFYQLSIDESSRPLTAFPTANGQYQWRVMPMGLTNAPAIFQKVMTSILSGHIGKGYCLVYIDDIIIYSKSLEQHAIHLDAVLTSLKEHNLFCQLPKCVWAQKEIKYLGHIVNSSGVKPDPAKVKALDNWDIPPECDKVDSNMSQLEKSTIRKRTIHEVRRFLGFMNYFNRFIPKYAELAGPLHAQTSDKAESWSAECTANWNTLRKLLAKATMMYHPVFDLPFHVYPDASMLSIGGCLMQMHNGISQPIAFIARKLLPAEQRYTTTEQEMLAMVYCFQKWRCYLDGTTVIVHTDHEPLTWLQTQPRPSHRQARWLEYLSRFHFKLAYIKGDKNVVADALSRMLYPLEESEEPLPADIWPTPIGSLNDGNSINMVYGRDDRAVSPNELSFRANRFQGDRVTKQATARVRTLVSLNRDGDYGIGTPHEAGVTGLIESQTIVTDGSGRPRKRAKDAPERRVSFCLAASGGTEDLCISGGCRPGDEARIFPRSHDQQVSGNGSSNGHHHGHSHNQLPQAGGADCILTVARVAAYGHTRARGRREPVWEEGNASYGGKLSPVSDSPMVDGIEGVLCPDISQGTEVMDGIPKSQVNGNGKGDTHDIHTQENLEQLDSDNSNNNQTQKVVNELVGHQAPSGLIPGGEPQEGSDPSLSSYETLLVNLLSRIKTSYMTDSIAQDTVRRERLGLTQSNELLWKNNLLYIPEDIQLKHDIIYWHHDVPWCAHLGIAKTLEMVKRQFWWPNMNNDISEYIKSCQSCQLNKVDRRLNRPPLYPNSLPDGCWRTVGIDLITDLPLTENGNDTIVHFVDHLGKMSRPIAARKTITAKGIAKLFFREIFPHYGMPNKIISDRDRRWNNEFFSELCRLVGIKVNLSTAAHPQTNGLTERGNEVIITALRHFCAADQKDWDEWLPFIEFAINSTYKESIQCTPFDMNRITLPRNPFDAMMAHVIQGQTVNAETTTFMGINSLNDPYQNGARTAIQAHAVFQWARKCLELSKQHMQQRHGKGKETHMEYKIGDLVWFSVSNLELKHPARRHKLLPKYIGPLKVIDIAGYNAVKLDMPKYLAIHPIVSTTQVKMYHSRDGIVPPVVINDSEEWEVDNIVNHNIFGKKGKTKVEFQVQWKGGAKDSWHEFADLEGCLDTLEKYLLQNCSLVKRTQILKLLSSKELALLSDTVKLT